MHRHTHVQMHCCLAFAIYVAKKNTVTLLTRKSWKRDEEGVFSQCGSRQRVLNADTSRGKLIKFSAISLSNSEVCCKIRQVEASFIPVPQELRLNQADILHLRLF